MLDLITDKLGDAHFVAGLLVAIGCAASVLTLAMPLLQTDNLGRRMKAVSSERDKIRQRERERLAAGQNKAVLRHEPKRLFKQVVDQFNLSSWLGTEKAKQQLAMAGYRGVGAEYTFLFFRLVTPIVFFVAAVVYIFLIIHWDKPVLMKIGYPRSPPPISASKDRRFFSPTRSPSARNRWSAPIRIRSTFC